MKIHVFVVNHILVKQEEMPELDEMNMKILRTSQNHSNTSEATLGHSEKPEKSWKRQ